MGKTHFYPHFVSIYVVLQAYHVAKGKSVWEKMSYIVMLINLKNTNYLLYSSKHYAKI